MPKKTDNGLFVSKPYTKAPDGLWLSEEFNIMSPHAQSLYMKMLAKWDPYDPEKPIDLISYLILRLSTEGDLVFDPFAGVGSTAMAAIKTNRRYLCVEKEAKYVDIARERIRIEQAQLTLDLG